MYEDIVCLEFPEPTETVSNEHNAYIHFRRGVLTEEVVKTLKAVEGVSHLFKDDEYRCSLNKAVLYSWDEIWDNFEKALSDKTLIFI